MRGALLALVLLSIRASAAPCPSSGGLPCTPPDKVKAEILRLMRESLELEAKMKSAHDALKGIDVGANPEAAKLTWDQALALDAKMKSRFAEIIRAVESGYNISPVAPSGRVVAPAIADPYGAWAVGRSASWNPQIKYSDKELAKIVGSDGREHYSGGPLDANMGGFTFADGTSVIGVAMIRNAVANGNPGLFASVLYHEVSHYNDLLTTGWGSRAAGEKKAYEAQLAAADVFELSAGVKKEIAEKLAKNQSDYLRKKMVSYFPDAAGEAKLKAAYELQKRSEADFERAYQELKETVDAQRRSRGAASDQRLRRLLADIVLLTCASPGSVSQAQLDSLPRAYDKQFYMKGMPDGLESDCAGPLYMTLAMRLASGSRLTATSIIPPTPAQAVSPNGGVVPATAKPAVAIHPSKATSRFAAFFLQFSALAKMACDAPGNLPEAPLFGIPIDAASYSEDDIMTAERWSANMPGCQRLVFLAIVRNLYQNRADRPGRQWFSAQASFAHTSLMPVSMPPPSSSGSDEKSDEKTRPVDDGKVPADKSRGEADRIKNGLR